MKDNMTLGEFMENLEKKNKEEISSQLQSLDFVQKKDMDGMLEATRDLTIRQVLDHDDCGKECGICSMKENLKDDSFKKGLIGGIKLKSKFPQADFNLGED